jgi:hypothetical protein
VYVIIEGWTDPSQPAPPLSDPTIDELLKSPYVDVLRRFRNSLLHPNPFFDARFYDLANVHADFRKWVVSLMDAFLDYFRAWQLSGEAKLADWDRLRGGQAIDRATGTPA